MNRTPAAMLLAALALVPIGPARAQDAVKLRLTAGHAIAVEMCSACHETPGVSASGPGSGAAPSFAEIANRPGASAESLRAFMTSPHFDEHKLAMNSSNAMLTPPEKDELIDYILSLRSGQ